MTDQRQNHLTEEEFVGFILEDLPLDVRERVDSHLGSCEVCAKELEAYYEAEEDFPEEKWEAERASFVADLRKRVFGTVAMENPTGTPVVNNRNNSMTDMRAIISNLKRVTEGLRNVIIALKRTDHLVYADTGALAEAKTGAHGETLSEGQTADGSLRWNVLEDEDGGLIVSFWSYELTLEGLRLKAKEGTFEQEIVLTRVMKDQIGARLTITPEEREQFGAIPLRVEVVAEDRVR